MDSSDHTATPQKRQHAKPQQTRSLLNYAVISYNYGYILNRRLVTWIKENGSKDWLVTWIEKNGSIGEEQAGFRRDHSTIDHIFTLFAVIQKYLLHKKKEKEEEEEKAFKNTHRHTHKQKNCMSPSFI